MQHFGAPDGSPAAAGEWVIFRHDAVVLSGREIGAGRGREPAGHC